MVWQAKYGVPCLYPHSTLRGQASVVGCCSESVSTEVSSDLNEDTLLQLSKKKSWSDGQIDDTHLSGTHTMFTS